MKWIFIIALLLGWAPADDRKAARFVKEGNSFYKEGKMAEAVGSYNRALNSGYHYVALFNKGNALFRQKKYAAAVDAFLLASGTQNKDSTLRSQAFYNLGVAYGIQNKSDAGIEAYKNALRVDWQNKDARENLQKALLELKKNQAERTQNQQENQPLSTKAGIKIQKELEKLEQKEKNTRKEVNNKKSLYGESTGKDW